MSLVGVTEAAKILGLSRKQLWDAVRQGLVPAVHVGRRVRFDPDALREWVAAGGRTFERGWRR